MAKREKGLSWPKFWLLLAVTSGLIGGLTACVGIQMVRDVDEPSRYFERAQARIEALRSQDPDRRGRPHRLHLLIHDGDARQLIRLSLPLWIVDGCLEGDDKAGDRRKKLSVERRYEVEWRSIRGLAELGPGLLLEVEDEENKILIWLE